MPGLGSPDVAAHHRRRHRVELAERAAAPRTSNTRRSSHASTSRAATASHVSHQVLGLVTGRQLPDRVCAATGFTVASAAVSTGPRAVANICAGYVNVINNIGAFDKSVVKIGTTRRLEPLDRIRELGDARRYRSRSTRTPCTSPMM
jgi:hypothetical protein